MKTIKTLLLFIVLSIANTAFAQCTVENHAVSGNEKYVYKLYFNWQFVWIPAGTGYITTTESTYKGQPAFKTSLVTHTSPTVDKMFRMRDTLLVYTSKGMAPLYYKKASHEAKRNYSDEVAYSYPNGKCAVNIRHWYNDGTTKKESYTYNNCVYDMLNIFLRARNYDTTGWKKGKVIPVDITGFDKLIKAKLIYGGKTSVKADNGNKYKCEILSYVEKSSDGKDNEIARFFVTDDAKHVPIRLDLFLKFGVAKAFLSSKL